MNPYLVPVVVFAATIVALAIVAIARGLRRVNWSTAKDVAASNARRISPVATGWADSEERAVRRLEGDPIPSRFDRW
jgi:hypothetical protein